MLARAVPLNVPLGRGAPRARARRLLGATLNDRRPPAGATPIAIRRVQGAIGQVIPMIGGRAAAVAVASAAAVPVAQAARSAINSPLAMEPQDANPRAHHAIAPRRITHQSARADPSDRAHPIVQTIVSHSNAAQATAQLDSNAARTGASILPAAVTLPAAAVLPAAGIPLRGATLVLRCGIQHQAAAGSVRGANAKRSGREVGAAIVPRNSAFVLRNREGRQSANGVRTPCSRSTPPS